MSNHTIYISELSAVRHTFSGHHFCRGNSNKRKSRFGIILSGSGTYLYLDKKLKVNAGDAVFIPENVFCYSEWCGAPVIEVVYLSCFMHYESLRYEPQRLSLCEEEKQEILQIAEMLSEGREQTLFAYSRFYHLLGTLLSKLRGSEVAQDGTLQAAVAHITEHIAEELSVADVARACRVSESTLYHLFKRVLGQTPVRFINSIRINLAIEQLENSDHSVATVSRLVGFRSENHFRKTFQSFTSTTPLKFKKSR